MLFKHLSELKHPINRRNLCSSTISLFKFIHFLVEIVKNLHSIYRITTVHNSHTEIDRYTMTSIRVDIMGSAERNQSWVLCYSQTNTTFVLLFLWISKLYSFDRSFILQTIWKCFLNTYKVICIGKLHGEQQVMPN